MIPMEQKRLTNQALVKHLMKAKGIEMITITDKQVLVQVKPKFTPADADRLCHEVGQDAARRVTTKEGRNFILFARH